MSDVRMFPLDGNGYEAPTDWERMEERIAALEAENASLREWLAAPCAECGHIDWRELPDSYGCERP